MEQPKLAQRGILSQLVRHALGEAFQTLLVVAAVYTLVNLALPRYIVEGRSMQPIFSGAGDERVLVNRAEYFLRDPQRGDIIVLQNPSDPKVFYIKRVIGLPHEQISMENGVVFVDGQAITEPYVLALCGNSNCTGRTWQLGADEYFVLGDNRNASLDSVSFGAVPRQLIVGRAWLHYWPPREWKLFEHYEYR